MALFGLATLIFGLSVTPWVSIAALMLLGASDMVSVYVRETLIALWTPDEVRGRVNAVNMVFVGASNELGEFRAGTMAAFMGAASAVVIGASARLPSPSSGRWGFRAAQDRQPAGAGGRSAGLKYFRGLFGLRRFLGFRRAVEDEIEEIPQPLPQGRIEDHAPSRWAWPFWAFGMVKRLSPWTTQRCIIARVSSAWNCTPQAFSP